MCEIKKNLDKALDVFEHQFLTTPLRRHRYEQLTYANKVNLATSFIK